MANVATTMPDELKTNLAPAKDSKDEKKDLKTSVPSADDSKKEDETTDAEIKEAEKVTNDAAKDKDEKTKSSEEKQAEQTQVSEPHVPVDVMAAGAADAALQQFMATENLQAATSAVSVPLSAVSVDPIWSHVDDTLKAPTCRKCLMPCTVENLVNKTKAEGRVNVVCKGCNSATTMLSRHLGQWPVPAFTGLSQEQQVGFWKQCHDIIQKQGRLDYGSIRACLTISLTERQHEIAKAKFTSEYLPVSVWVTRGFKEDDVRKGLKEDHPLLGETFAIPLKTVSKEYIREKVEEMITTFEAAVRKKKGAKASVPASSATAAPVEPGEDTDLVELTWLEPKSPAAKKRPAEEIEVPEETHVDPKKQRQMASELRRHNTQVNKLAQKGLDVLNPLLGTLMKHMANKDILPAALCADLKEVNTCLGDVIVQCQDGLKSPGPDERLPDLPFDAKSLATKVKEMKQVFTNVDRMMKLINKSGPKAK